LGLHSFNHPLIQFFTQSLAEELTLHVLGLGHRFALLVGLLEAAELAPDLLHLSLDVVDLQVGANGKELTETRALERNE